MCYSKILLNTIVFFSLFVFHTFGDIISDLECHWMLDEGSGIDLIDATDNGHNTQISGARWDTDITCHAMNYSLRFDGFDDCVTEPGFSYTANNCFSISVRFKIGPETDNGTTSYPAIFSHGTYGASSSLSVYLIKDDGRIRTYLNDYYCRPGKTALDASDQNYYDDQWHIYTLTVAPGCIKVYVDGEEKASSSCGGGYYNPYGYVRLGCAYYNGSYFRYFGGYIDDLRIYRRALNAGDVSELNDICNTGDPLDPVTHLQINNDNRATISYDPLNDVTGNGHNGIINNGTLWFPDRCETINSSLYFDETDDHIQISDFNYTCKNEFTLSLWFKLEENTGDYYKYIYSHGALGTCNSLNIYFLEDGISSGKLRTYLRDICGCPGYGALDVNENLADGEWHLYTLSVSSGNIKVYIDGAEKVSSSSSFSFFNPQTDVFIGRREDGDVSRYYGGLVDDIRLYDYNLNQSDVNDLYYQCDDQDAKILTAVNARTIGANTSSNYLEIGCDPSDENLKQSAILEFNFCNITPILSAELTLEEACNDNCDPDVEEIIIGRSIEEFNTIDTNYYDPPTGYASASFTVDGCTHGKPYTIDVTEIVNEMMDEGIYVLVLKMANNNTGNLGSKRFDQVNVTLKIIESEPNTDPIVLGENSMLKDMGDYYVLGGDILLDKTDDYHMQTVRSIVEYESGESCVDITGNRGLKTHSSWPHGVVKYNLNGFTADEVDDIFQAMENIAAACNVIFVPTAGTDYVYNIYSTDLGPGVAGESKLGYTKDSYCKLSPGQWGVGNAMHEFLHGLGYSHEHQRMDRDDYVTINWGNIIEDKKHNFEIEPSLGYYPFNAEIIGEYDYGSIMHYGPRTFSANGGITIDAHGNDIGQREALSEIDIQSLITVYGMPVTVFIDVHRAEWDPTYHLEFEHWATRFDKNKHENRYVTGNFNGDHFYDVAKIYNEGGLASIDVYVSVQSEFRLEPHWAERQGGYWWTQKWVSGDFNRDGLDDLANIFNDHGLASIDVHLSNETGFDEYEHWTLQQGGFWDAQKWLAGDFNGDGFCDLANVWNDNGLTSINVHVSDGERFTIERYWAQQQGGFWDAQQWQAGDFNGDGICDLANVWNDNGYASVNVHTSNGSSFTIERYWAQQQGGFWDAQQWRSGDFNNDGKTDLAKVFNDNGLASTDVHLSDGTSFSMSRWETRQGGFWSGQWWLAADFTGDYMCDIANFFHAQ